MQSRKKPKSRPVINVCKTSLNKVFNQSVQYKYGKICVLFCFLFGSVFLAKAQIFDKFEDDLTSNPPWKGDVAKFKINAGMLQSQSAIANDRFYISTPSKTIKNTQWEFFLSFQFRTSSLNYIDIFLCSDSASLLGQNSGYFIRVGGADDEISFYKKSANLITKLIDGKNGVTDNISNSFRIKMVCDSAHKFSLFLDSGNLGNGYLLSGEVVNSVIKSSSFAGILVKQSVSSFFNKHFFDDFYIGKIISDTIKPKIIEAVIHNDRNIRLIFSEPLNPEASDLKNFEITDGIRFSDSVFFLDKDSTQLNVRFSKVIPVNQTHTLLIKGCKDKFGNAMRDTFISLIRWSASIPLPSELIINEFLSDPDPPIALPKVEFVELLNVSKNVIQLQNCSFGDPSTLAFLPEFVLEPDSFVLLCSFENQAYLEQYGKVIGLKDFPSLNNSGDELILRNSKGTLLHRVVYSLNQYSNSLKSAGGWSFEIIDKFSACHRYNFTFSENSDGGTPGKSNSLHLIPPNISKPFIKNIRFKTSTKIELEFSKNLDSTLVVNASNYKITGNSIKSVVCVFEKLQIEFGNAWVIGEIMQIELSQIKDCLGNYMSDTLVSIGLPAEASSGDILINEILFNPPTGGADFVEIYNQSRKVLSLNNLAFFNRDQEGKMDEMSLIDTINSILMPNEIIVFSTKIDWLPKYYKSSEPKFIKHIGKLPAMDDKSGQIGLCNASGLIIDEIPYSESMHLPLLTDFEGVSIERIDNSISGFEATNFTSAAASYGFATPGLSNSHRVGTQLTEDWLEIEPDLVSPDQDGFSDLAAIRLNTSRQGCQATIIIFDLRGHVIKTIVNNIPVGNSQTWFWNGTDELNRKANIGIYIVYAELFGLDGKRQVKKKTITVGGR